MGRITYIEEQLSLFQKKFMDVSGLKLLISTWKKVGKEVVYSVLLSSLGISLLSLVFPLSLLQIYDRIIPNNSTATLIWLVLAVLISLFLSILLKILRTYVGAWADAKFEHSIGCQAFNKILNCQLLQYEKEGSGRHLKRITTLNMLKQFYSGQALISLIDAPFILVFLLLIFYIGGRIVFIPIGIIIGYFLITFNNTFVIRGLLKERQDHDDRRLNFIVETISKIQTIKSNTMEAQMLRRFERLQKTSTLYDYKMTKQTAGLLGNSMLFSQLTVIFIVAYGGVMVFTGTLSIGSLAACTLLAGQCMQPLNAIISMISRLQTIKIAHAELNKILAMESESSASQQPVEKIVGKIEFENVSFQYSSDGPFIIKNCNLTIMPFETISISSEKLTGKSTLLFLLLKLITPTEGRILIDDKDIAIYSPKSLRNFIGYMSQHASIFQGTILENLTLFKEEYEDRAKELSKQIGLSQFVEYLPNSYDTKVGTQITETLPRGVQQYIVVIRALLQNPPIILFDEADITVDMEGDRKIRELLETLRGKCTMILVSHRPSILAIAHKKYRLEDGQLRLIS